MLDYFDDDDQPAHLTSSVGEGGANLAADVRNVQSRLNSIDPDDGGPDDSLAVDGICGPLTRAAIKRFQQRYHPPLLTDGRVDRDKNTWKKLISLTGSADESGLDAKAPGHAPAPAPAGDPEMPLIAMWMATYRIREVLAALDIAANELDSINLQSLFTPNPAHALFKTYVANVGSMRELPTVDRCFHIANERMTFGNVKEILRRLRSIYSTMMDVIVTTMITTPKAEKTGTRRFVRIINQGTMNRIHPGGAIADAPDQGWWKKNANLAHIRIGSGHLNDTDLITTMIHEMSHFVSHPSTFIVGQHVSGIYNKAFNDNHHQAVRNAFCYEWYAYLASFKTQRSLPNSALVLT